jgi:hypothetical protein
MKSHFSYVNQIGCSQNFVVQYASKSLVTLWKEVKKQNKKRKSILYLKLLKKQKKKAFLLKNFQATNYAQKAFALDAKVCENGAKAHSCLFKKQKKVFAPAIHFYHTENFENIDCMRHNGYNAHGEILWRHSQKYRV